MDDIQFVVVKFMCAVADLILGYPECFCVVAMFVLAVPTAALMQYLFPEKETDGPEPVGFVAGCPDAASGLLLSDCVVRDCDVVSEDGHERKPRTRRRSKVVADAVEICGTSAEQV